MPHAYAVAVTSQSAINDQKTMLPCIAVIKQCNHTFLRITFAVLFVVIIKYVKCRIKKLNNAFFN